MAPEQVRGEPANARTDVWALGVLLYAMVSGTPPFGASTAPELFSAILRDAPTALPATVPEPVRAVIERCLEKDPARRYQRAENVGKALRSAESPMPRHRFSRGIGLAAAAMAGVTLLALGLNMNALRTPPPSAPAGRAFDSLAVLPLEDLSGPGQDYFAPGMHEALIVGLGKLSGLRRVIARPSVLRYARMDRPLREVAAELGVQALITGTVLQSGNRVRVTAQLVDPETERQVWAESYERDMRDVLALQNEIVAAIARQVQLQISPAEHATLSRARQVNPEAYRAYLKGVFQINTLTPVGFERGMALMREAVALDSDRAAGVCRTRTRLQPGRSVQSRDGPG